MATAATSSVQSILSDVVLPENVWFGFLRFGQECNAAGSHSFSDAFCCIGNITYRNQTVIFTKNFSKVFERGIKVISYVKSGDQDKLKTWKSHDWDALQKLKNYLLEKELHEKSLNNVLKKNHNVSDGNKVRESEVTVVLAEHLLRKLAPGHSYSIDKQLHNIRKCTCREDHCKSDPILGNNGIGHDEVWHGFVDIIFASHDGISPESSICTVTTLNKIDTATFSSEEESGTPSKKMKYEEDEPLSDLELSTSGAEDQIVAKTVVFSFIQRFRHPQFHNHLIPNIVIDSSHFRILMYDSENDYLLCSMLLPIFEENGYTLSLTSILILWMVLHYRIFCSGIDEHENLSEVHSNFKVIVGEKLPIYSTALKVCEAKFNASRKSVFPSNDMFIYMKPI